MEIILHVGLHKTGTTSLQHALCKRYSRQEVGKPWYPPPRSHRPGHAEMSWRWLGILEFEGCPDSTELQAVVARAYAAKCPTLILSAEDFSWAYPNHMGRLAEISSFGETRIVVTVSPLWQRALSLWQHSVRGGNEHSLRNSEAFVASRLIEAEFVEALVSTFGRRVSVIIVDRDVSSDQVYGHFTDATAIPILPLASDELARANKSLSAQEIELMRLCNNVRRRLGIPYDSASGIQAALECLFVDDRWRELANLRPPSIPTDWFSWLFDRATNTAERLDRLQRQGDIKIFGDIRRLNSAARPQFETAELSTEKLFSPEVVLTAMVLLHQEARIEIEKLRDQLARKDKIFAECGTSLNATKRWWFSEFLGTFSAHRKQLRSSLAGIARYLKKE